MEHSIKAAGVLAVAAAILAGGAAGASAAPVKPQLFCAASKASLVKVSDQELAPGSAACSQGASN